MIISELKCNKKEANTHTQLETKLIWKTQHNY